MKFIRERLMALYLAIITLSAVVVIGSGTNTSSIGSLTDTGKPSKSIIAGSPLAIRSDEFLRASPTQLSVLQDGNSNSLFDYTQSSYFVASQKGTIETIKKVLNFDYQIYFLAAKSLPIDVGFSAMWWLYSLLALYFVPLWMRELGVPTDLAIVSGILTWLVPTNHWWSMWPLVPIGLSALAGYLFLRFARSIKPMRELNLISIVKIATLGLFTASVASRIPFTYQPWGIPVALFFFSVTFTEIFFSKNFNRTQRLFSSAVILSGLCLTVLYFWASKDLYSNLLSTVYPGQRRSGINSVSIPLWAGPVDWQFQFMKYSDFLLSNQSELAIGILVLIPIAFAAFMSRNKDLKAAWQTNNKTLISLAISSVFLLWTLAPWPSKMLHLNPLTLLPPERVAQILGVLVMMIFILVLADRNNESQARLQKNSSNPLGLAFFALIITTFGIQQIQTFIAPGVLQPKEIWLTSLVLAFVIAVPFKYKQISLGMLPLIVFSTFSVMFVNPVMSGVGEVIHSNSAEIVRNGIASNSGRWAADDMFLDALLIANGANMLSGQQGSGPNYQAWEMLDPSHVNINAWNRGSNYVVFSWRNESEMIEIVNPTPDVIQVSVNPCDSRLKELNLGWIASRSPLSNNCLSSVGESDWMGREFFVYKVEAQN